MSFAPLLAHGGPGAAWQALVTVLAVLTAALFVAVVLRLVKVHQPGDLILPLAGVVVIGSLGPSASDTLSDGIGWAIPLGVVAVIGLLLYAISPDGLAITSPLVIGLVVAAVVASVALQAPLSRALHTVSLFDPSQKPPTDDAAITVTAPPDGATVPTSFDLTVALTGATVGPPVLDPADAPRDPEELGRVRLLLNGSTILIVDPRETCTVAAPCSTVTFPLELPAGTHQVFVEFTRWDGVTFATAVFSRVQVVVEG